MTSTLADRQRTKAAELGVSVRTIEGKRARYTAQGLWGLVDQRDADLRSHRPSRRRPVEVLRELIAAETTDSTGNRSRLMRRATKMVEERHGPGAVPLPGKSAFYELMDRLTVGRHTFGSAPTRRQTANRPDKAFTATIATRPGEQIQIGCSTLNRVLQPHGSIPGFPTKKAAEAKAREIDADRQRGAFIDPDGNLALADWAEAWFDALDFAPTTLSQYRPATTSCRAGATPDSTRSAESPSSAGPRNSVPPATRAPPSPRSSRC